LVGKYFVLFLLSPNAFLLTISTSPARIAAFLFFAFIYYLVVLVHDVDLLYKFKLIRFNSSYHHFFVNEALVRISNNRSYFGFLHVQSYLQYVGVKGQSNVTVYFGVRLIHQKPSNILYVFFVFNIIVKILTF
jgi:hypothetical protein